MARGTSRRQITHHQQLATQPITLATGRSVSPAVTSQIQKKGPRSLAYHHYMLYNVQRSSKTGQTILSMSRSQVTPPPQTDWEHPVTFVTGYETSKLIGTSQQLKPHNICVGGYAPRARGWSQQSRQVHLALKIRHKAGEHQGTTTDVEFLLLDMVDLSQASVANAP